MTLPAVLDEAEIMTLQGVARYLHCHYTTVKRLVHAGGLPVFRLGSDSRIMRADLEKWIAAGGGKPYGSAPVKPTRRTG
jgi:excisionase family DNA binding protein